MFPALIFTSMQFSSCKGMLHAHDFEWKYNEETHWKECKKCKTKFGVSEHRINYLTNRCTICDYIDPVIKVDKSSKMTGLTKFGKKKKTLDQDQLDGIQYIAKDALVGSQAKDIILPRSLVGYYKGAFNGLSSETTVTTIEEKEGGKVNWIEINDIFYKDSVFDRSEAMMNNIFYATFEDAVNNVRKDDETITLLRPVIKSSGNPVRVNYNIVLDSYYKQTELYTEFLITASGCMRIPEKVHYKGIARLELSKVKEPYKNPSNNRDAYTSGSLVFLDTKTKPQCVGDVYYVKPGENDDEYVAVGANQAFSESLLSGLRECFAYGCYKFNYDFNQIYGLSTFGTSLSKLTVTNVIKDKTVEIADWAFTTELTIKVKIPSIFVGDITIHLDQQKGAYSSLIVGSGVKKIGTLACSNWFDGSTIPPEASSFLGPIVSPLQTVEIGDDVEEIGQQAFYYCLGLTNVVGGSTEGYFSKLKTIGPSAFSNCHNLKSANFAKCINLEEIKEGAFITNKSLTNFTFPSYEGWKAGSTSYLPETLEDTSVAARLVSVDHCHDVWQRNSSATYKCCYFDPTQKDNEGRYNHVTYSETFDNAFQNYSEGNILCLLDVDGEQSIGDRTITKSVSIKQMGKEGNWSIKNITIEKDKYLILDSNILIEDGSTITLQRNGDNEKHLNVAGFAVEKPTSLNVSNGYTVKYADVTQSGYHLKANKTTATLKNYKTFDAYGLFNFNRVQGQTETLTSLSKLGLLATELTVGAQEFSDTNFEIIVNKDTLNGNAGIKTIIFGDKIRKIPTDFTKPVRNTLETVSFDYQITTIDNYAFANCEKLSTVLFNESSTYLETIGKNAFANCKSLTTIHLPENSDYKLNSIGVNAFVNSGLKEFYFGKIASGWKSGSRVFSEEELKDCKTAAKYLTSDFTGSEWTRNK